MIHGVISKTVFNHGGKRFDSCLNSSADGNKGRSLSLSSPGNRIMNAFYLQPYFIKFLKKKKLNLICVGNILDVKKKKENEMAKLAPRVWMQTLINSSALQYVIL